MSITRKTWSILILLLLLLEFRRSWMRSETFWAVCALVAILFAVVQLIRKFSVQRQFRDAQQWSLTRGGFSGNYEDGGSRVVYYGYKVAGSYYTGFIVAGSTLKMKLKSQLDALKGKPAFVRYKPGQPEISTC